MQELTKTDINILIEALEKWESGDAFGNLLGVMFGSLLEEEEKVEYEKKQAEKQQKEMAAMRARKEQGIFLKAKLLTMRDCREIEQLCDTKEGKQ